MTLLLFIIQLSVFQLNAEHKPNFSPVYFEYNDTTISDDQKLEIKRVSNYWELNRSDTVKLTGFTDIDGSEKYNWKLSLMRAKAVRQILLNFGMDSSHILVIAKGEMDCDIKSECRKVEFEIIDGNPFPGQKFEVQHQFTINKGYIQLFISDYIDIDGDIVRVSCNDSIIFPKLKLTQNLKKVPLDYLSTGMNYISIEAISQGVKGLATPRFIMETTDSTYTFYLKAAYSKPAAVIINYQQ